MTIRKITISIPEEVYLIVEERRAGRPFSQSLCELVRRGAGRDEDIIPGMNKSYPEDIDSLKEDLRAMAGRIDILEQRIDDSHAEEEETASKHLQERIEEITGMIEAIAKAIAAEPIIPGLGISESSRKELLGWLKMGKEIEDKSIEGGTPSMTNSHHPEKSIHVTKKSQAINQDRVPITDDIIQKIRDLQRSGMKNIDIGKILGHERKSYASSIISREIKSISQKDYDSLMAM